MAKKILLVRHTPYDPKINTYNIQEVGIGKAFCKLGYDYDHICYKKHDQKDSVFFEENGCKARFIEFPRFRLFRWGINRKLCSKEFLSQYDIVISREYYQIMTFLMARNHPNVSMYSGPYWNMFFFKFMSPLYDLIIGRKLASLLKCSFVKSGMAERFLAVKGYKNIINVGVGLDMAKFDNENEVLPETQDIITYMSNNKCILYVGNLNANKNLPFMIKLFQELKNEEPNLKFIMIGKSVNSAIAKVFGQKDEDYAKKQFAKLPEDIQKDIWHIKRVNNSQLKYIYPLAKAFILPSKHEIFGMVLAEAMYLGAPVVSSYNGGSTSMIEGKNTGIIINNFDIIKWKNAVLKLIRDTKYSNTIKANAHQLIKDEYTWDAIAKKMIYEIEKANTPS